MGEEAMKRTLRSRSFVVSVVCLALAGTLLRPAHAQDISGKPIRILVGVAAGGATDVTARLIAQKLSASLHTNVFVENKTGGAFEPVFRELTSAAPPIRILVGVAAGGATDVTARLIALAIIGYLLQWISS
jgi:tripartite-type tricarboxylate transporter receptor subunit TctC